MRVSGWLVGAALAMSVGAGAQTTAEVREGFLHPSADARPMVRWWWFGPAVEKPEIRRELEQMKADGIGGAELAFVYPEALDDAAAGVKNLPFLSPAMLDAVSYAQGEGRRLGLRIDVTLCSGWPYGGPATTLKEAAGRLRIAEVAVPAGGTEVVAPELAEGESLVAAALVRGVPKSWDAGTAQALAGVRFAASGEPRVALFFVASHTKQQVKRAAVGAEGYVLDPFSHEAVATHLRAVGEPLVGAFGGTPPYAIFSDSLEAYGADWTAKLPEEFRRRRGYDLLPHLPELAAAGAPTPAAERVRHDYGRTLTELVNENYLVQINDWAKAHGTRFRSQTYGEPAVSFSSQRLVGLAEGEGSQWRAFSTLRWASSANHVFGQKVTSGETFTWLHSPVFRATPLDMKAEADVDFLSGENQLIFHGWPYSAPSAGEPGWSLYAAAALNDHNPWYPVMRDVTAYLTRLSWLLRQGEPANQVAVLLPTDDAWAGFRPGKVSVTKAMETLVPREMMRAILAAGYNVDFIDAAAVERVGLGTHQVLVVPPTKRIPAATVAAIERWKSGGGKVVVLGQAPTLDAEGEPMAAGRPLGVAVGDVAGLGGALREQVPPDMVLDTDAAQVGFIRRRLAGQDAYYLVNTGNTAVHANARLSSRFARGERLNPETGAVAGAVMAAEVRLDLAPYESEVLLFSAAAPEKRVAGKTVAGKTVATLELGGEWKVRFGNEGQTEAERLPYDWASDAARLHYSGEVSYSTDVTVRRSAGLHSFLVVDGGVATGGMADTKAEHVVKVDGLPNPLVTGTGPGMHAYYDPPVREAAEVYVNGRRAGALWHPPYRLEVSELLKPGVNHVEIRVYNTALNAWSALPPRDYAPLKAKYGDRFQMQDLDQVRPLPSGIPGTVKLVQERE